MKLGAIHRPTPSKRIRAGLSVVGGYRARERVDYMEGLTFDGSNPMGNDVISNCVPAAFLRLAQVRWKRISGDDINPQADWATALYSQWTGYQPDVPASDKGADVLDAVAQWGTTGIHVRPGLLDIGPWFAVPTLNLSRVRAAVDVGVGCLFTVELFDGDLDSDMWDAVGADSPALGGHEVAAVAYDADAFSVVSWGRIVQISNHGMAQRLDAVQVPLSRLVTNSKGITGAGQDWAQVIATMDEIDNG